MLPLECLPHRRAILKSSVAFAAGFSALAAAGGLAVSTLPAPNAAAAENSWIIGPQPGFTPEVGTLVSMLAFTREQVVHNVQGLTHGRSGLAARRQSQHHRRAAAASGCDGKFLRGGHL